MVYVWAREEGEEGGVGEGGHQPGRANTAEAAGNVTPVAPHWECLQMVPGVSSLQYVYEPEAGPPGLHTARHQ